MKKIVTYRITTEADAKVKLLAQKFGLTQGAVVELSVVAMAKREKIVIPKEK